MKKAILILLVCFLPLTVFAQLADTAESIGNGIEVVKEKVFGDKDKESDDKICPVYSNTKYEDIVRRRWEIELGLNVLMEPTNGSIQGSIGSFTGSLTHNFTEAFGTYIRYDYINFTKDEYLDSPYHKNWNIQAGYWGFHLYIFPTFKAFIGAGTIQMKDGDGNSAELETPVERGISYDIPVYGYKIVLGYRTVSAKVADSNKKKSSTALSDGSYSAYSITLSLPFGKKTT